MGRRGDFGRIAAVKYGNPAFSRDAVREEAIGGMPVPHLQGMHTELIIHAIDVDQDLRGVADAGNRPTGVTPPHGRDVGNGAQLVEVRAHDLERIRQQLVGGPLPGKHREVVEDVGGLGALLSYDLLNLSTEEIEPGARVNPPHCHSRSR